MTLKEIIDCLAYDAQFVVSPNDKAKYKKAVEILRLVQKEAKEKSPNY